MPNVNDKIMIELVLNAKKAIQEAQKAVNAISGIKDKEYQADKDNAKKQEETAEKTAKIQQTVAKKTSSVIGKEMSSLLKGMFTLGAVIKGIQLFNHFASMGADIRYMANAAGMAEGRFEKLGNAARKLGGSYASTGSTVRNLRLMLERLKFEAGGPLVEAARQYGLQFTKNGLPMTTEELMRSIARTMGEMGKAGDKSGQINLASLLGLDDATFRMMQDGEAMYLRRIKEAEATDAAAKAASKEYMEATREFKESVDKLGMEIVTPLLQILTPLVKFLTGGIKGFRKEVKEKGWGEALKQTDTAHGRYSPDAMDWIMAQNAQSTDWNAVDKGIKEFMLASVNAAGATPIIIPPGAVGGMGTVGAININQTFNGRTDPAQVARASEQGTSAAISRSGLGLSAAAQLGGGR